MTLTEIRFTEYMGLKEKGATTRAFHLVNNLHDFTGMHGIEGNFCYDHFSVKVMLHCIA